MTDGDQLELRPPRDGWPDECKACGYPLRDGRCAECDAKAAAARAAERQHMADLGGPMPYADFKLDSYTTTETNRAVVDAARAFDPARDNLYLWGPTGVGKSHLAVAVARTFWPKLRPLVRKPTQVAREARPNGRGGGQEAETIATYTRCPVLVLDDLGVEKDTAFSHQVLYEIIEGRCLARRNGLIITTNLRLNDLAAKLGDDRIPSRLNGLCRVLALDKEPDRRGAWKDRGGHG